ncbi:peptide methionine sulfoxide reductase MsrB [Leptospira ryugenii]|uniref:Peptide methionine sulfoxide reductase MsrB n=1 Tax=Leptospira ryugenii TaxID=1917863 RepID=A0A2P2DVE2_9LEPT|nr:peptide-methionine (R)-S-oxide reductase MsrB [Leptospira ryugenii]GBF48611.1 peptide methionine sulfoxide reductase MsrB [Leptospira ryugenii]
MDEKIKLNEEELKKKLSPLAFHVTQNKGTERPFTGEYYQHKEEGVYVCACCEQELFSSETKYESGSGWPSYYQAISKTAIEEEVDLSHGMKRVEIHCSRCGAHLGHVFPDGPRPTGLRYCVNSLSLGFKRKD